MYIKNIIFCNILIVFTAVHAMGQKHAALYDYALFKNIQTVSHDIQIILESYDEDYNRSLYDICHARHHTTSGLFIESSRFGMCITYALHTPWGEFLLARLQGKDEDHNCKFTLSDKKETCLYLIQKYIQKNIEFTQCLLQEKEQLKTEHKFCQITRFKNNDIISTRDNRDRTKLEKEALADAWKELKEQYNKELVGDK